MVAHGTNDAASTQSLDSESSSRLRVRTSEPARSTRATNAPTYLTGFTSRAAPGRTGSALALVDLLGGDRQHAVQVTHDAEVDELEDRRLLVLVHGHDGLGGLHAGAVLGRPGDAV